MVVVWTSIDFDATYNREDLGDRINDTRTANKMVHKGHEIVCYWAENPLLDESLCARFKAPPRYATPEETTSLSVAYQQPAQDNLPIPSPVHVGPTEVTSYSPVLSSGFDQQPLFDSNTAPNPHFSFLSTISANSIEPEQFYGGSYGIDPKLLFNEALNFDLPFEGMFEDRRGSTVSLSSYIPTPSDSSFAHSPGSYVSPYYPGPSSNLNPNIPSMSLGNIHDSSEQFNDGLASNFLLYESSNDFDAFCDSLLNFN